MSETSGGVIPFSQGLNVTGDGFERAAARISRALALIDHAPPDVDEAALLELVRDVLTSDGDSEAVSP